jgi:pimeloyl-ACP methyl ester carboxylesterase
MRIKLVVIFFLYSPAIFGWNIRPVTAQSFPEKSNGNTSAQNSVKAETLNLFDKTRNRAVPVALYSPASVSGKSKAKLKLAILNHGYGMKNTEYSFLAEMLVARGFLVASIQHEISGDEPIPTVGKPSEVRRPNWERSVRNILFVIDELKKIRPRLDFKNLLVVGHSNGGDAVMLFAEKYPPKAAKIISLDNRRMPIPRIKKPQILSIRSSDQMADEGVLPTADEQKKLGIEIVKLKNTKHDEMWDGASIEQKQEISRIISSFL